MPMLKLVPMVFLFLFIQFGVQVQLPAGQSYAWCCQTNCKNPCGLCYCAGTHGCPFCRSGDTDISQPTALIDNVTMDMRAVRNFDVTDRVMHLTKVGDCTRDNFALRVLGNAGEILKTESFSFGEENMLDRAVALKLAASAE